MPKLYSARQILSASKRAGFTQVSQKGSHIKLTKKQSEKTLIVIVPFHKEVALGTFQSILKQASLTREEFEKFIR